MSYGLATIIFFNLCDGDEINGAPGISVINYLEKLNAIYTGANPDFYKITTSKIIMKQYFDQCDVPTPKWAVINKDNINEVFETLGKTYNHQTSCLRRIYGCLGKKCGEQLCRLSIMH
jgi:D-alanine-D-alanine ligase-like ATP-grasp enzyme